MSPGSSSQRSQGSSQISLPCPAATARSSSVAHRFALATVSDCSVVAAIGAVRSRNGRRGKAFSARRTASRVSARRAKSEASSSSSRRAVGDLQLVGDFTQRYVTSDPNYHLHLIVTQLGGDTSR